MTQPGESSSDPRSVIAVNLEFLEQLAWKAWRDAAREAGSDEHPAAVRAAFNTWWGWQAATIEHGDWSLER